MWVFNLFIWVSGWGAGSTITMLSLIKWISPLWYHERGTHHSLSAAHWVYDACLEGGLVSTLNNHLCDAAAAEPHQLMQCLSQPVKSNLPANTAQTHPPPPPPPPGRCQSYVLALGWMEGTCPDYIHCDTAWVWMQAGCFSVTHAPSVTLGSSSSSPCYRWSLFWSWVLSLIQMLWLHLCFSGFVPRLCT